MSFTQPPTQDNNGNEAAGPAWYQMALTNESDDMAQQQYSSVHDGNDNHYSKQQMANAQQTGTARSTISESWFSSLPSTSPYDKFSNASATPRVESVIDCFSLARHNRVEHLADLLNRGLAPDVRDEFGNTMLAIACQNGNRRLVKLLLRNGADINMRNRLGNTPLHFACRYFGSDAPLVAYLMAKGADSAVRNSEGQLCFDAGNLK